MFVYSVSFQRKSKHDLYFDDLISGASDDIKQACMEELQALDKDLNKEENYDNDHEFLVADYKSDDDSDGNKEENEKENEENVEEHITKVRHFRNTEIRQKKVRRYIPVNIKVNKFLCDNLSLL